MVSRSQCVDSANQHPKFGGALVSEPFDFEFPILGQKRDPVNLKTLVIAPP